MTHLNKAALLIALASTSFSGAALAHSHDHHHSHNSTIQQGTFSDADVHDRALTDWQGSWQSIYPFLKDGSLDAVFRHKAEHDPQKSAGAYKAYYDKGYASDVTGLKITADSMTFERGVKAVTGRYDYSGYKILTYPSGKKGVRYLFTRSGGDAQAPRFVQFSDHEIGPNHAAHFHLFFGDSSHEQLEKELVNWPTFFPAGMTGADVAGDLMHE
ncbi:ZinT/AdcA family metal-binding protein [Erwinia oleae]|uniref:ZinT/AdcA family metal-binding protein n=1 Tax=Erwinia oleae TaxID=796334 RepID=UPI00054D900E|nr:ZinT/AdcA family metal-binding protein [Erwinia oleae]